MPSNEEGRRNRPRVRPRALRAKRADALPEEAERLAHNWRTLFFEALSASSNITQSCAAAGVSRSTVYDLLRRDARFARRWTAALCEGYDTLEMELLDRLRHGDTGEVRFNYAVAMRALQAHQEKVAREKARRAGVAAADVRASIMRKLAGLRVRVLAKDSLDATDGMNAEERRDER